jgi:serine phosphatase RsbU (regulator of sigma subunit)
VWSSTSYEPHLLSLPFALAPAAMLIVIAYTAVMRGAPVLRGFLLCHCLSLLPYALVMTLSPSVTSPDAAEELFRAGVSTIPMAAATGTGFQLALIGQYRRFRWLVWLLVASAAIWIVVSSTSNAAVGSVRRLSGFWYPEAGPYAWVALIHTVILSVGGFLSLGRAALWSKPSDERRQLRAAFFANMVTYAGLIDVGLAYGIGVFPLGWLLSGVGSLLVVRALIVEDLLRVRAVDTAAPLLVVHFAGGTLLGWVTLSLLPPGSPWWMQATVIAISLIGVRMLVTTFALIDRGARRGGGPLERLLNQLVVRTRKLTESPPIAQLASDIVDLGIGTRPAILLASEEDWGFTSQTGEPLSEELMPDPLIVSYLAEERELWIVWADDLEPLPADLQEPIRVLLDRHRARAFIIVRSVDELLAIIAIPRTLRKLRGGQLEFLARVSERLAEALLHARMARRAALRAVLAREVELAATVQGELLPGRGPHVHGAVTVVGSWKPATRCAGDFWGVYPLTKGRVLIAIGDVTGHGVASAMVTAGAAGACDVCVRRGDELDLAELIGSLDAAVRRVGGGELAMTCFAAILDPTAKEIRFVSCGHPAPYLLRTAPEGTTLEISALVGRGNLLGAGVPALPKVQQRPLEAGDLVVWYTDGVIDALDPAGKPYGDRRLQQLLKKLDRTKLSPASVHDVVQAGIATHRANTPLIDDETVVVAQVARS